MALDNQSVRSECALRARLKDNGRLLDGWKLNQGWLALAQLPAACEKLGPQLTGTRVRSGGTFPPAGASSGAPPKDFRYIKQAREKFKLHQLHNHDKLSTARTLSSRLSFPTRVVSSPSGSYIVLYFEGETAR